MGNHGRISHLRHKIEEYEGYINELEEAYCTMERLRAEIDECNEEPLRNFDISSAGAWEGNLESEAEDHRNEILSGIAVGQDSASDFISDVQGIIETLHDRIREYESEIDRLEAEEDNPY